MPKYIRYALPRDEKVKTPNQKSAIHEMYETTNQSTYKTWQKKEATELFQPAFVKMDRHVLRYYGYFKEAVVESKLEQSRLRKLILFFYLEDGSLSMTEPRQVNSGLPQGALLKRQKTTRDGSEDPYNFIDIEDFVVGQDIIIHGKTIRLYDCDEYTREFYMNLNAP